SKKGIAPQTAMRGKPNAGYPPHATAGTHWSKDTLGVPLLQPCPLRLDAVQPKRLASGLNFPLSIYSVFRKENVSRDTKTIFRGLCFGGLAHLPHGSANLAFQRVRSAAWRSLASSLLSFWRTAFADVPLNPPSSLAFPPFNLNSTSKCNSESV